MIKTDIIVVGSGAAGMTAAIELSKRFKITLITKNSLIDSSTWYAQGGIAAVIDSNDTIEEHLRDTLIAGDGLCNEAAVLECVSNGKEAINWLRDLVQTLLLIKKIICTLLKKEATQKEGSCTPKTLQEKKFQVL